MSMSVLERETLAPVPEVDVLQQEVMRRAETELRYPGSLVVGRQTNRAKTLEALAAAGVKPFTAKSVAKYKFRFWLKDRLTAWAISLGIWAASAGTAFGLVKFAMWLSPQGPGLLGGILAAIGVVAGIVGAIFGIGALVTSCGTDHTQWRTCRMSEFDAEVPTFVLLTAMNVKRELEKRGLHYSFGIDAFRLPNAAEIRQADPFLYLEAGGQRYYLEVWDEPGFAREREV